MDNSNPFEARPPMRPPVQMRHWTARGRAVSLVIYLLLINAAGALIATHAINQPVPDGNIWERLPGTIILVSAISTVLVGMPLIAFLCLGWYARYDEFQNSLKNDALDAYLKRFWSKWLLQTIQFAERQERKTPTAIGNADRWNRFSEYWPALGDRLFANIYHEQYGLWAFAPPFLILLAVTYGDHGDRDVAVYAGRLRVVGPGDLRVRTQRPADRLGDRRRADVRRQRFGTEHPASRAQRIRRVLVFAAAFPRDTARARRGICAVGRQPAACRDRVHADDPAGRPDHEDGSPARREKRDRA
ncbi:hypothetical protein [Burkholderia ubonensis]|uniref:hypothetical protein n=1 Tax=Burkholderia ubonensis TaxID=101571 RepID=UPI000AEA0D29|nr:hypothetical protein [Burkholderia ubonensis]